MAEPRTALVLSGGGIVGGAWMVGALQSILATTGWDPRTSDWLLGTSAGSMLAALLAAGVSPDRMATQLRLGESAVGAQLKFHWTFPRPVLASPGLAWRSIREPWRYGPAGIVAWLPQGVLSTEPIRQAVRRMVPEGWDSRNNLWIAAVDYETGQRVVFGRPGAPRATLAAAVAASCAVPGFYHPVRIHGRRYIDGGLYTPANLDLLLDCEAEVVICLSPMTSSYRGRFLEPTSRVASFVRGGNRARLLRDAEALERAGKRVLLVEPHAEDLRAMGYNYMSGRRSRQVLDTSLRSTAAALRDTRLGRAFSSLVAGAAPSDASLAG